MARMPSQPADLGLAELDNNTSPAESPLCSNLSDFIPQLSSTLVAERQATPKLLQSQLARESPRGRIREVTRMLSAHTRNDEFESSYLANMGIYSSIQYHKINTAPPVDNLIPNPIPTSFVNDKQSEAIEPQTHSPVPNRNEVRTNDDKVVELKLPTEGNMEQSKESSSVYSLKDKLAQDLAQISHYEVLDLRKRNSLGLPCAADRQTRLSKEEQVALEHSIESNDARRKLNFNLATIRPLRVSIAKPNKSMLSKMALLSAAEPPKVSNSSIGEHHESRELINYLGLKDKSQNQSQSSQHKKRRLSTVIGEDLIDTSPKPQRHRYSKVADEIEIAPAPQALAAAVDDDILIMSPPPSNVMCRSQNDKQIVSIEEEQGQPFGYYGPMQPLNNPGTLTITHCGEPLPSNTSLFFPAAAPKLKDTTTRNSKCRLRRSQQNMSKELSEYLALQETIGKRLKSSFGTSAKRRLYTKGNSDIEDNLSESPLNKRRLASKVTTESAVAVPLNSRGRHCSKYKEERFSGIEIAPAPPAFKCAGTDDIEIVPPPPNSIRYSREMCMTRHSKQNMSNNQEKLQNKQYQEEKPQKKIQHENVQHKVVQQELVDYRQVQSALEETQLEHIEQKKMRHKEIHYQHEQVQREETKDNQVHHEEIQDDEVHHESQDEEVQDEKIKDQQVQHKQNKQVSAHIQTNLEHSRMSMEALRMETPSPTVPSISQQSVMDEQPSTSKAAREGLKLSLSRQQALKTKPDKQGALKKRRRKQQPLTAPRSKPKKSKIENTLCKLPIKKKTATVATMNKEKENDQQNTSELRRSNRSSLPLRNNPATGATINKEKESDQQNTSELRRSKRGHVPLRNNWSHTLDNPFDFLNRSSTSDKSNRTSKKSLASKQDSSLKYSSQCEKSHFVSWLKGVCKEKPASNVQFLSEYFLENVSTVEDLEFSNINGIEYASYRNEDVCTLGYMRFQPLQERGMTNTKSIPLFFLVLFGKFKVEYKQDDASTLEQCILNSWDTVDIKKDRSFNITNLLNEVSVLMVVHNKQ